MTRQGSEGGPGAQRRPRALQGQLLLCAPWLPLPLPSPPLGTKYPCGSWGALPFLGHDLADVEFSPGGLLRSGCLPSGAPWNPAPSGGHPAETGGLPRRRAPLTLSSLHAFLSLLPWRIHHAFCSAARPPTPAPCLLSPCVCVVFPSAHPAARPPPTPPWLLLARLGSASGRNWQRPPGGRSWVSAAQRLAEPRCVRDPRQVSVGPSQPQAHRVACTVACGASRSGWRHRCRRGRWAGSGPTGVSGGALGGHGCHPGGRAGQRGWAGLGCWMGRTPWAAWSSG